VQRDEYTTIPRVNVLGVGISDLNLESATKCLLELSEIPELQGYVTITGVHGVVESQADEELKKIHNQSLLTTPDGMPMVWFGNWSGYRDMDRVYGPDLMLELLGVGGKKHYLFGGAEGVAELLEKKLCKKFPQITIVGRNTPPFRPLSEEELESFHQELQTLQPNFVWVGLSTPKQERFMHGFLKKYPNLTRNWDHGLVFLGVGAAFDFHSGIIKQAPRWIQRSGFEWLFRTLMDPRRLLKRYAVSNTIFVSKVIPQMMGLKNYPMPR